MNYKKSILLSFALVSGLSLMNTNLLGFQLFVKTMTGKTIQIEAEPSDTGAQLKQQIFQQEGIPVKSQSLIFAGRLLADEQTLEEQGVGKEANLSLRMPFAIRRPEIGEQVLLARVEHTPKNCYQPGDEVIVKKGQGFVIGRILATSYVYQVDLGTETKYILPNYIIGETK